MEESKKFVSEMIVFSIIFTCSIIGFLENVSFYNTFLSIFVLISLVVVLNEL